MPPAKAEPGQTIKEDLGSHLLEVWKFVNDGAGRFGPGLKHQILAALIYKLVYFGPKTQPPSRVDCATHHLLGSKKSQFLTDNSINQRRCVQLHITEADCKEAHKIIEAWLADIDWSRAQHQVGADFGVANCRKTNETIDQKACKALATHQQFGAKTIPEATK
jgi:hypothetical protein